MATIRQAAVELMRRLVQSNRGYELGAGHTWTNLTTESIYGRDVLVPSGNMDCSGSVMNVYKAIGLVDEWSDASTRDIDLVLCDNVKFRFHPWDDSYEMKPGDLALCQIPGDIGHVAMCVSEDFRLAEFWPGEGGREVPFYFYPIVGAEWNICIELVVGDQVWSNSTVPGGSTGGGSGENLVVDGWWGSSTTAALQRHYGTIADGEVWGQWQPNVSANTALTSGWVCDHGSGSPMIRKLQEDLGTSIDGVFGGPDIYAFQARCGQPQTGVLIGPDESVKVLQRRLNAGTW